jgi:hypothetical protein
MNKRPEEEEPAFKVVDKRRFDDEGHEKPCCDHEHDHEHDHGQAQDKQVLNNPPKTTPENNSRPTMPMTFSLFVQTLAHQAMMGLGLVPWPDSNLIRKDAVVAKETIDLLLMLKTKTAGNLDKDEQALLDGIVYQLQVAFVEIIK